MCRGVNRGEYEEVAVKVPYYLSHTGNTKWKRAKVDKCIASIVRVLQNDGLYTISSCCGHGKRNGSILLQDGRELVVRARGESA